MKLFKNILIATAALSLSACNFLEFDEATGTTEKAAFNSYSNLKSFITACYSGLPSDFGAIGNALREAATDNAVFTDDASAVYDVYDNKWSAVNQIDNTWATNYKYIYRCNYFLENIREEQMELFEWDPNYEEYQDELALHFFEARALRVFYHFELLKRYGDIPLVTKVLTAAEANSVEKTSFDNVIAFIVSECDAIAPELPETYAGWYSSQTGRCTRGFVKAMKARALLYAASPLHNASNDKAKWEKAAEAAFDIMDDQFYSLEPNASDPLFAKEGNNVLTSKQLIFERRMSNANTFELRNLPAGFHVRINANGGNTPTENLASVYQMADGTDFDFETHKNQMYYNEYGAPTRDPRFYRVIVADGTKLNGKEVETFEEGANNLSSQMGATLTGYYLKRYVYPTLKLDTNAETKTPHHYILYRYAEVLLNYAEAMFEATGSATGTTATCTATALQAFNEVRAAAGMPAYADLTQQDIRDERRRELAFEDHRFWDIRRWKIGDVVKDIKGIVITKDATTGVKSYEIKTIQTRTWDDKMYLYPFPQSEVIINPNLGQNPGW